MMAPVLKTRLYIDTKWGLFPHINVYTWLWGEYLQYSNQQSHSSTLRRKLRIRASEQSILLLRYIDFWVWKPKEGRSGVCIHSAVLSRSLSSYILSEQLGSRRLLVRTQSHHRQEAALSGLASWLELLKKVRRFISYMHFLAKIYLRVQRPLHGFEWIASWIWNMIKLEKKYFSTPNLRLA